MSRVHGVLWLAAALGLAPASAAGQPARDTGLQLAENPPMELITRDPPPPAPVAAGFEVRDGFRVVESLDAFRAAIRGDGQKIRLKPGVYRATTVDPPIRFELRNAAPDADGRRPVREQQHIFAVTGSNNHFDLRGAVIETPVSLQSRLSGKAHVSDSWHINGSGNTFEGGFFRNVVDLPYPDYRATENEFEVCNDGNTFLDCVFVIRGSVPFGYSDYYGKGGPNFGRLNKHSFMSIDHADDTRLIGCRVHLQSFGHCVHLHTANRVRIERCLLSGTLRPTNDIFRETAGRASEYGFRIMYRGERPIPRDQVIPLTEDGVRSYENVRNVTVIDTVIERMRGCIQLLCVGDVTLENVTVREAGDFAYDLGAAGLGRVVMTNCRSDAAYRPVFNLSRGAVPVGARYELTVVDAPEAARPTAQACLGVICGERCTFVIRDGITRPLPDGAARLECGGRHGLRDSSVTNETAATLVLGPGVRDCVIRSLGPVEDRGEGNRVTRLGPGSAEHPARAGRIRGEVLPTPGGPVPRDGR